jgi:hypothetical protein
MNPPDWNNWNWYTVGSIDYSGSDVILGNNRLSVQVQSLSDMAGIGIMTKKPFLVTNREYRVLVDNSMLEGTNNSVRIILSDRQWFSNRPDDIANSLQLIYEKNIDNYRQWRLMRTVNGVRTDIWTSADSSSHYILFQFISPDTLILKVHESENYRGPWGGHLSMAYLFLTEYNMHGETAAPVYFDEVFIGPIGTTSVREVGGPEPREYSVKQNYPNPFNPLTLIQYEVPVQSRVSIEVYNILGEHVSTLVDEVQNAGRYEAPLSGIQLASGVYYYRFKASDPVTGFIKATDVGKAILIK